jgi:hypothetical protein
VADQISGKERAYKVGDIVRYRHVDTEASGKVLSFGAERLGRKPRLAGSPATSHRSAYYSCLASMISDGTVIQAGHAVCIAPPRFT